MALMKYAEVLKKLDLVPEAAKRSTPGSTP